MDLVSEKIVGAPWDIDINETEKGIFRYGADRVIPANSFPAYDDKSISCSFLAE